jgi:hypothetical protein
MTTLTLSPHDRLRPIRRRETAVTFAAAALFLVVLAATAIAVALALPSVPDIGSLSITVT